MREATSSRSPHLGRKAQRRRAQAERRGGGRFASAARAGSVASSGTRHDANASRRGLSSRGEEISIDRAGPAGGARAPRRTHRALLGAGESRPSSGGG